MNPEVKEAWCQALESGEYRQGEGYLRLVTPAKGSERTPGYCCLGVLCELALKAGIITAEHLDADDPGRHTVVQYGEGWDGSCAVLPNVVRDWAGLGSNRTPALVTVTVGDEETQLSRLNDSGEYDFPAIAQVIRECL